MNVNSHGSCGSLPGVAARKHPRRRTSPSPSTLCVSASSNKIALTLKARNTSLATTTTTPRSVVGYHHTALGAFTLTGCPIASLRYIVTYDFEQTPLDQDSADDEEEPNSDPDIDTPTPAFTHTSIPSISRTASPFSTDEWGAYSIPPGWPMPHKRKTRERRKSRSSKHPMHSDDFDPRSSRRSLPVCAGCKKQGSNFPRCRGCSALWCSRECRISSVHLCGVRR